MQRCTICQSAMNLPWLDLGPQTLTNRFLTEPTSQEYTHPCALSICPACSTVQLASAVPLDEMRPRFDWISYNEPEQHLDDVVDVITRLPGVSTQSTIAGITYKDDSTLERLNRKGFANTWRADMNADLGLDSPRAGIESIQAALNPRTAERILARHGHADVVLLRHVLEHSERITDLLAAARALVRPGGYLMLEMPDARRALERLDYTTIWEEHLYYFTPTTLRRVLGHFAFDVCFLESYDFSLENSLVAIARPSSQAYPMSVSEQASREECHRATRFIAEFPAARAALHKKLRQLRGERGTLALLGAGHLSAAYVNFYDLREVISFVVDDNPHKQGLLMPGSQLPILPASELLARNARVCLMSVRPEVEDAVIAKNSAFIKSGGILASVFPESRYSLARVTGEVSR
jgi:hypothetical protein